MKDASFESKLYIEKQDLTEDELITKLLLEYKIIIVDDKDIRKKLIRKYPSLKEKIIIE